MRVRLVTPAPPGGHHGNRVTAERWAAILDSLGHEVRVETGYQGEPADLLIALHARKSADAVRRFRERHPERPLVLALTGTDLYPALGASDVPVLELASRLVVLQPLAAAQVPDHLRDRVWVIYQSAEPRDPVPPRPDRFDVALLAHLRAVKDPLLAASATRLLPSASRVQVHHAGAALDPALAERATRESRENPRYRWHGDLPREDASRLLLSSRLLLLTSRNEGGANVVSEALAAGVAVLATAIPGNAGILGADYPGYFPVGDPAALAGLLHRAETDLGWYARLRDACAQRRPLVDPARERAAWRDLLAEVGASKPTGAER